MYASRALALYFFSAFNPPAAPAPAATRVEVPSPDPSSDPSPADPSKSSLPVPRVSTSLGTQSPRKNSGVRVPRVDGIGIGAAFGGHGALLRMTKSNKNDRLGGGGLHLSVCEQVYPWLGLGLDFGTFSLHSKTRSLNVGYLQFDAGFYPMFRKNPRLQPSIRVATGLGGGFVKTKGKEKREGMGGASFRFALRLEWFPWAHQRRPKIGGGFALAPELGVYLFPPTAKGKTRASSLYGALGLRYHFGS